MDFGRTHSTGTYSPVLFGWSPYFNSTFIAFRGTNDLKDIYTDINVMPKGVPQWSDLKLHRGIVARAEGLPISFDG